MPDFRLEQALYEQRYRLVAGADEAGRGPLAGPLVVGVAVLPHARGDPPSWLMAVRDSKKLSPLQRERALATLRQHAIDIVTGEATWEEIDDIGLTRATHLALSRAIERLKVQPDFYLLDQMPLPNLPCKAVKKGDDLCYSIAAASIAAKVTRDHRMVEMETHFPGYGFARHKGYPSAKHMEALWRLGPSPIHRRSFAPVKRCLEAMSG